MGSTAEDLKIQQDVVAALHSDVRLDTRNVNVSVVNGVAHLYGSVPTYVQKLVAGEDAERVKGVRGVINYLEVQLVKPVQDAEIALDVRGRLIRDSRIRDESAIHVVVTHGVVSLSGCVPTAEQERDAVEDAESIPGVVDVVDHLGVARPSS